ncbi:MAG: 3-dehydroquinate synthase [Chloroflexota bacterium]
MTETETIKLTVQHPTGHYPVYVGQGLLPGQLAQLGQLAGTDGPLVVISDSNVGPLYADRIETQTVLTMPAGEQHKTLATVNHLYDQLLAAGIDRSGTIVALGGGVVGDVAGFVAATYLRGVNFVQCPTSLLAMVDASVGGKTGVDLPQGKNLVGAFKQPQAVIADLDTLATLPPVELSAGMAEVIKHGLIANPDLFVQLELDGGRRTDDGSSVFGPSSSVIATAIQVKRDVVEADPFEQGPRALLNLGHTFGHAIEQVSGYGVGHGQAVAMGLVAAANLSARLGYTAPELQGRIERLLQRWQLPTRIPADYEPTALLAAMGSDKKKLAGHLRFILLRDIGQVFIAGNVAETAVLATLHELRE